MTNKNITLYDSVSLTLNKSERITCLAEKEIRSPTYKWILLNTNVLNNLKNISDLFNEKNDYVLLGDSYSNSIELYGSFKVQNKSLLCLVEHHLLKEAYFNSVELSLKCKFLIKFFNV